MTDIFHAVIITDTFWALIGFFIFFVLLISFKVPLILVKTLDRRAERISNELEEAQTLREEAQKLLVEYQHKCIEAENEADAIIKTAKHDADALVAEARIQVKNYITRRNKIAEQRIIQAENDAFYHVCSYLVDTAFSAVAIVLEKNIKIKTDKLVESSLNEIETIFYQGQSHATTKPSFLHLKYKTLYQ